MNYKIKNMVKAITCRFNNTNMDIFIQLNRVSNIVAINQIKSKAIFCKLYNSVRNTVKVVESKIRLKLYLRFLTWKELTKINKINQKKKKEYEKAITQKNDKELIVVEAKLKEKEKDLLEVKKSIQKSEDLEVELSKKFKNLGDRESKLKESIKVTEVRFSIITIIIII